MKFSVSRFQQRSQRQESWVSSSLEYDVVSLNKDYDYPIRISLQLEGDLEEMKLKKNVEEYAMSLINSASFE